MSKDGYGGYFAFSTGYNFEFRSKCSTENVEFEPRFYNMLNKIAPQLPNSSFCGGNGY